MNHHHPSCGYIINNVGTKLVDHTSASSVTNSGKLDAWTGSRLCDYTATTATTCCLRSRYLL